MNEPQHSNKMSEMRPILRTIGNTSKELFREIVIKSTKSLINVWDELFLKPEIMSKYLKKMWFSDAIIDAAMRQAWFAEKEGNMPKEPI